MVESYKIYPKRVSCNIPNCMAMAEYECKQVDVCAYHYNIIFVKGEIQK